MNSSSNHASHSRDISCDLFVSPEAFRMPRKLVPSTWFEHAPFMFWLIKTARPSLTVELGVANGFSYFTQCQAIADMGLTTKCFGIDTWRGDARTGKYGDTAFCTAFNYNKQNYSGFSCLLRSTFDDALKHFADGSVDVLHIDGFHTYPSVRNDFTQWLPKASRQAVVLLHDTNVRERDFGVWRLWEELKGSYPSFEFYHGYGLGVLAVGESIPADLRPLFDASDVQRAQIQQIYARLGAAVTLQYENEYLRAQLSTAPSAATASQAAQAPAPAFSGWSNGGASRRNRFAPVVTAYRSKLGLIHLKLEGALRRRACSAKRALRRHLKTVWVFATGPHAPSVVQKTAIHLRNRVVALLSPSLAARYCSAPQSGSSLSRPMVAALRHIIVSSGHFDRAWYLATNPDVARAGMDPVLHYLRNGAQEGRDPSPLFSTATYRTTNGLLASPINPLVHYCLVVRGQRAVRT